MTSDIRSVLALQFRAPVFVLFLDTAWFKIKLLKSYFRPYPKSGDLFLECYVSSSLFIELYEGNGRLRLELQNSCVLLNLGEPRPLFHLFSVFPNKPCIFYNKLMWKKCPFTIWCWDSNSWLYESPLLTTEPGLLSFITDTFRIKRASYFDQRCCCNYPIRIICGKRPVYFIKGLFICLS